MKLKTQHKKYLAIIVATFCIHYFIGKIIYNKLVDEAHFLHIAHGRVETEMQRRHDIVTRTASAVNGYMETEGRLIDHLAELNGLIESGSDGIRQGNLKAEIIILLNRLTLLVEAYPDLRSKEPSIFLMETLQQTGRRVTEQRMRYNKTAYDYNRFCRIFPYNIFARAFGFHMETFFKADESASTVPLIKPL